MNQTLRTFHLDESIYPLPGAGEKRRYLLTKDASREVILMIWGPGALSPIHDHAGSECWTTVLKGEIVERTFNRETLSLVSEDILRCQETAYVDKDEGVHQLLNASSDFVYTLHLYEKPLSHCNVYDLESGQWTILKNHYDEFQEARV